MAGEYHFDDISGVHATEDGEFLIIETVSASGSAGIRIPAKHAARVALMIFEAAAHARQITRLETFQAMPVNELRVRDNPAEAHVCLLATLHTGAPPVALSLSRGQLEEFASGILDTARRASVAKPDKLQ